MTISTHFSGLNFRLEHKKALQANGFIDDKILNRITSPERYLKASNIFLNTFATFPSNAQKEKLLDELQDDLANFLFMGSLMDYGNIGTSESFSLHLRNLYRRYPFLFRPYDSFWRKLEERGPEIAKKIISSILISISGLARTDFENVVVPNWINIIKFLREKCNNDAANFFLYMTKSLLIEKNDPMALAIFQKILTKGNRKKLKEQLGINFSLGPKTGILFLSIMTDNLRGFNVLKGVSRNQIKKLKAPVDSAVIRVMLNTGLVKITSVNPERKEGKFVRTDMTEVCQNAMDLFSEKLGIISIEFDMYVWAVGTMPCKHRGSFCFICPFTEICDSWKYGYVKESSGKDYLDRCFSFARPQTEKNALYLRGCHNCSHRSSCIEIDRSKNIRHPLYGDFYTSRRYTDSKEKLLLDEIMRHRNMNMWGEN